MAGIYRNRTRPAPIETPKPAAPKRARKAKPKAPSLAAQTDSESTNPAASEED